MFRENDFVDATVENVIRTLNDLGITYHSDVDDGEVMYIVTDDDYTIDFVDGVCVCSYGVEEYEED